MLRHTYTAQNQIRQFTCSDCRKRKTCIKLKNYKSIYQRERRDICSDFIKIPRGRPKVSIPEDDCRELLHQIMLSRCIAEGIQNEYMMDWISPHSMMESGSPTFSECTMFVDVLGTFRQHILEFKEMYSNCRKDLDDLIQTVIRVEGFTVMIYLEIEEDTPSSIKFLKKKLEETVGNSKFQLEYKSYDEILGRELPEVREKSTE